jgi:hypothetical protein
MVVLVSRSLDEMCVPLVVTSAARKQSAVIPDGTYDFTIAGVRLQRIASACLSACAFSIAFRGCQAQHTLLETASRASREALSPQSGDHSSAHLLPLGRHGWASVDC